MIPRLVDSSGQVSVQRGRDSNLDPAAWGVQEVSQFLEINECATLADPFAEQASLKTSSSCVDFPDGDLMGFFFRRLTANVSSH